MRFLDELWIIEFCL